MIKILECFSSGGWKRIYSILLNLISHMMEENGSFSFQKLLDDIREFAQYRDLLKISFPEVQNSSPVVISSEEIESLENQYMLAYMIKKTEKIHKEIKEKAIKKRKNNISIKRFFIRKPKDAAEGNKLNLKLADKSHFRDLAEKELYKDLLNLYHTEHLKLEKDVEIINSINPKSEAKDQDIISQFEAASQKLEILKETREVLKVDIFKKKQESKMASARRKMRRKQIKDIRRKQRANTRSRNNAGPYCDQNTQAYNIDVRLETRKDHEANACITQNNRQVKFLTHDIEDLESRICALEFKINSYLKPDYDRVKTDMENCKSKSEELNEFKNSLEAQISSLNEQFRIDIIGKFSEIGAVESLQKIIYNSIS